MTRRESELVCAGKDSVEIGTCTSIYGTVSNVAMPFENFVPASCVEFDGALTLAAGQATRGASEAGHRSRPIQAGIYSRNHHDSSIGLELAHGPSPDLLGRKQKM